MSHEMQDIKKVILPDVEGGKRISNGLTARTMSVPLDARRRENIVALVGGQSKVAATRAVLASGLLSGLITDEQTAKTLLTEV